MIEVLDASIYPGAQGAVIDNFTSTPLTIERISGNSEGAITGWAFTNDFMPAVNKLPKSGQFRADTDPRHLPGGTMDIQPFRTANLHPDRQVGRGSGSQGSGSKPGQLQAHIPDLAAFLPVQGLGCWFLIDGKMEKACRSYQPVRERQPGSTVLLRK